VKLVAITGPDQGEGRERGQVRQAERAWPAGASPATTKAERLARAMGTDGCDQRIHARPTRSPPSGSHVKSAWR